MPPSKLTEPGVYQMPLEAYLADPAPEPSLSASIAHVLLEQTPLHAWLKHPRLNPQYEREESSRLDLGSGAHALLLEGDESRVVAIAADDWRTKAAKVERDDARANGLLPILKKDWDIIYKMVGVAMDAIVESEFADDFAKGTPEQTLLWHDGIWQRCRPDMLAADQRITFEYKTVKGSASPEVWSKKAVLQHGYDIQAAMIIEGVKAVYEVDTTVVFIVQEIEPPYAVSFVSLDPKWQAFARAKLREAQRLWEACLHIRDTAWPSYSRRVAYVEAPGWAMLGMNPWGADNELHIQESSSE